MIMPCPDSHGPTPILIFGEWKVYPDYSVSHNGKDILNCDGGIHRRTDGAAMARALAPIAFEHWENYVLNSVTLSRDAVHALQLNEPSMKTYFSEYHEIFVPHLATLPSRDVATIVAEWGG
jgi:hypothetical protein